jgi:protein translocase SEC61 complex gamma subunit
MAAAGSDLIDSKLVKPFDKNIKEALSFINRCEKPNFDEMSKISTVVATGFVVMGLIGFFVKLFSMPLNQVLMS